MACATRRVSRRFSSPSVGSYGTGRSCHNLDNAAGQLRPPPSTQVVGSWKGRAAARGYFEGGYQSVRATTESSLHTNLDHPPEGSDIELTANKWHLLPSRVFPARLHRSRHKWLMPDNRDFKRDAKAIRRMQHAALARVEHPIDSDSDNDSESPFLLVVDSDVETNLLDESGEHVSR